MYWIATTCATSHTSTPMFILQSYSSEALCHDLSKSFASCYYRFHSLFFFVVCIPISFLLSLLYYPSYLAVPRELSGLYPVRPCIYPSLVSWYWYFLHISELFSRCPSSSPLLSSYSLSHFLYVATCEIYNVESTVRNIK